MEDEGDFLEMRRTDVRGGAGGGYVESVGV